MEKQIRLTIQRIQTEAEDFKTIQFHSVGIRYKAGQYLTFLFDTGFEQIRRSYSLISSPALNEPLTIGVKRIPNGIFSRFLTDKAAPGDELTTTGAAGFFTLPEEVDAYKKIFFFAAGSGITPVISLIKELIAAHKTITPVLVYSSPTPSRILFRHKLEEILLRFPDRLKLHMFISDSKIVSEAHINKDRVQQIVSAYGNFREDALYYICGPESYMRMCTYALQEMQVNPLCIRKENFAVEKPKLPDRIPPDTALHHVYLQYSDANYQFQMQYPDTILKAARSNGIDIPFSCDTGKCGSCAATCVRGEVWMSYNEVLTENELKKGLVLTCVGYPVHGDVHLVI